MARTVARRADASRGEGSSCARGSSRPPVRDDDPGAGCLLSAGCLPPLRAEPPRVSGVAGAARTSVRLRPKRPHPLTNLCASAVSKGLGVASRGPGNGLEAAARMRRPLRFPPTCLLVLLDQSRAPRRWFRLATISDASQGGRKPDHAVKKVTPNTAHRALNRCFARGEPRHGSGGPAASVGTQRHRRQTNVPSTYGALGRPALRRTGRSTPTCGFRWGSAPADHRAPAASGRVAAAERLRAAGASSPTPSARRSTARRYAAAHACADCAGPRRTEA